VYLIFWKKNHKPIFFNTIVFQYIGTHIIINYWNQPNELKKYSKALWKQLQLILENFKQQNLFNGHVNRLGKI
jgi:hypothetical protein